MALTIAFSGKGGSGKTTLAALVLRRLVETGRRPVLAVDADPNATLGLALGVEPPGTVADLREEIGKAAIEQPTASKDRLMDQGLAQILGEHDGFDLLTMGRPEGPKCYCYVNSLLRRYLSALRGSYACVVVDCEAGMEYLSRLTVEEVDALVLVAEATTVGLTTARRISSLADALPMRVRRRVLALNKAGLAGARPPAGAEAPPVQAAVEVPYDADLLARTAAGETPERAAGPALRRAVAELAERCLGG